MRVDDESDLFLESESLEPSRDLGFGPSREDVEREICNDFREEESSYLDLI